MSFKCENQERLAKLSRNHFLTSNDKLWEENLCGWELQIKVAGNTGKRELGGMKYINQTYCLKFIWKLSNATAFCTVKSSKLVTNFRFNCKHLINQWRNLWLQCFIVNPHTKSHLETAENFLYLKLSNTWLGYFDKNSNRIMIPIWFI